MFVASTETAFIVVTAMDLTLMHVLIMVRTAEHEADNITAAHLLIHRGHAQILSGD
jgi:hypothetical protein